MRSRGRRGRGGRGGSLPHLPLLPLLPLLSCAPTGEAANRLGADSSYIMVRLGGNALVVPRGFTVSAFADDVRGVRLLALGPESVVYATVPRDGRVVRLPDDEGDGRADRVEAVVDDLREPHGLAFRGDTLYVAEIHRVVRLVPPDGRLEVVVQGLPDDAGHRSRTVIFDGDEMYVAVGSSCNLCREWDPQRAAITRYAPDGTGETLYATGLRNSVGLTIHPETGELWATNNDRDRLGDDIPPDRVNVIREGGWYGWPECYLPNTPNPEYAGETARCAGAIGPAVTLPAHSAPLGLAFYTGDLFPEQYRGDLFVALHGSWDRSAPIGYEVVRIPMENGSPAGPAEPFVSGWQIGRRSWGRPVDVLVRPDGSLLISDDAGGKVYRVWYSRSQEGRPDG